MVLPEYDLTDKVALVTGAGRGIGTGIAEALAEAGAGVAVNARTKRYVEPFAHELGERTGRDVRPVVADATDPLEVTRMIEGVLASFGRVDVLVNNLGDAMRNPLVALPGDPDGREVDEAEIGQVLDLNLFSAIYCTRALGRHLLERGSGKVINISSYGAVRARPNQTLYTAGKAGLIGLTKALALEWAPYGIQVNAIAPGNFPDPVTVGEEGYDRAVREAPERIPLGRVGELREVGLLAVYLASAASDYVTGQVIGIDGGLSL